MAGPCTSLPGDAGGVQVKIGKGEIFVLLSAAGFGVMPVLAKFAYSFGCNVSQVLLYRFIAASIFLWLYALVSHKSYRLNHKKIICLMMMGMAGYDTTAVLAFTSFKYISAGLADLLLFLYPPLIVVTRRIFFKENISKPAVLALLLSITGICLIVWTPDVTYNALGLTVGILSSVTYSLYVLSLGLKLLKDIDGIVITTYVVTFCTVGILIYSLVSGSPMELPGVYGLVFIVLLAVFSTVLPIFFFCLGVKYIGSSKASIISTVEPAIATLAGAVLLGESISIFTVFGGLFIISGIILLQMRRKRDDIL